MIRTLVTLGEKTYHTDLSAPIDLSIPIHPDGPRAWYVEPMKISPVRTARFTGSVAEGGAVNFRDIWFNPHGHGTHTECAGHIQEEVQSINQTLTRFFAAAALVSIDPSVYEGPELAHMRSGDLVINEENMRKAFASAGRVDAVVVRTQPNTAAKRHTDYSHTNPAYFAPEALAYLRKCGVKHLLTDLPSVDREEDGGGLLAHRAFWQSGHPGDAECTITEFVFVPDSVADGLYLLNLQVAPFENDASPSRPVLYALRPA